MQFFYKEKLHRMECMAQEPMLFEDIPCQMIDMIDPENESFLTLRDLKRCKISGNVFNILFNLNKFMAFETRDPFLIRRERSPKFQADSVIKALENLKVDKCSVVGFSYGGMVAFKMAESRADMVQSLNVSGSVIAITDSISDSCLERLGFSSSSQLLLPESVKGLKALLSIAAYKKLWFPNCIYKDFLQVMFNNRKERAELLEGLVISNKDAQVPILEQRVLLLWGENDNIFNLELAQNMLEDVSSINMVKSGHSEC